jgi:carboxymethylenebutenolidase
MHHSSLHSYFFGALCVLCGSLTPITSETVSLRSGKDAAKGFLYHPEGKGPFPAIVILHGDFGPTEWVKKQAQRLAARGYLILVIDLYRGEMPKDIEEAHILERALPEERVLRDLKAAIDHLAASPLLQKDRIGILGWDMGGGYALDGAIYDPRLRAAVICYGRLRTDPKLLAKMKGSALGIFAGADEGISTDTIKQFQKAMTKAGKRVTINIIPGVGNGFMDPASPYLSRPAPPAVIADAWRRIDAYLDAELKK